MAISIENGTEFFVFHEGMIEKISSAIATETDENVIPASGPLTNIGIDNNGVTKNITITGRLFDTDSTVVSTQDIRDKYVMKLWLEALQNGAQVARTFISPTEKFSVIGDGTSTITDGVSGQTITLQAIFGSTKVYVKQVNVDDEEANQTLPFTMTLWVAGS